MERELTEEEVAELAKARERRATGGGTVPWAEAKRRIDADPDPFTPPLDWTTPDAAALAREFVKHATADPRLPLDWGAMIVWFSRAIAAGAADARADMAPTRFDPDDRSTWPPNGEYVLVFRVNGRRWGLERFEIVDGDDGGWWAGDLWLPLPPTPEAER